MEIGLLQEARSISCAEAHPCLVFYLELKVPCVAWYNGDHVIVEIAGRYYDHIGEVTGIVDDYLPLKEYGIDHLLKSFYKLKPKHQLLLCELLSH